jgi:peptidoglycan/LPS O-acetylase OafA/YrhL
LLDSLRGAGAVAVVAAHVAINGRTVPPGALLRPYVERFDVVLIVFFMLSAFLLYRPFVVARLEGRSASVPGYAVRRFLRVVPAYWAALILITLWLGLGTFWDPLGLLTYFGFLQGYKANTISGGLPQAWTLVVEAAFYAFLAVWAKAMTWLPRRDRRAVLRAELWGVAGLVVLSVAYKAIVIGSLPGDRVAGRPEPMMYTLPAQLDFFAVGMGLAAVSAWLATGGGLPRRLVGPAARPGVCWGVAGVAMLASTRVGLTGAYDEGYTGSEYAARHVLYAVAALGLILPGVIGVRDGGRVRRFMALRPLAYLGTISYGIYLWHLAVMVQLQRWGWAGEAGPGPFLELYVPTLGGGVLAGVVSWRILQRPMLRWGPTWRPRLARNATMPSVAPRR